MSKAAIHTDNAPAAIGTYSQAIEANGLVFLSGQVALDPATGKVVYKTRIDRKARNFTASPWAYNGKIFCLNEEGDTFVVKAGGALGADPGGR